MFRKKPDIFAPGFPATDEVKAKKIKGGTLLLINGTNAFSIANPDQYTEISVKDAEGGAKNIVGKLFGGNECVLARFGSASAAANGHAALIKAHSGLTLGGMGFAMKAVLGVVAIWFVFGLFSSPGNSAIASAPASPVLAGAPALPGGSTPSAAAPVNPSLDDLANGGYQFTAPKIQMPNVQAPTLDCAPVN